MNAYTKYHIPATGIVFVSGIASAYDEYFYESTLQHILTKDDIHCVISSLNEGLESFWPCTPCYVFGYGCMVCTVGLSLLCPRICISQAEAEATKILHDFNAQPKYYDRNITFQLKKSCCTSYVELSVPTNLLFHDSNQTLHEDIIGTIHDPPTAIDSLINRNHPDDHVYVLMKE